MFDLLCSFFISYQISDRYLNYGYWDNSPILKGKYINIPLDINLDSVNFRYQSYRCLSIDEEKKEFFWRSLDSKYHFCNVVPMMMPAYETRDIMCSTDIKLINNVYIEKDILKDIEKISNIEAFLSSEYSIFDNHKWSLAELKSYPKFKCITKQRHVGLILGFDEPTKLKIRNLYFGIVNKLGHIDIRTISDMISIKTDCNDKNAIISYINKEKLNWSYIQKDVELSDVVIETKEEKTMKSIRKSNIKNKKISKEISMLVNRIIGMERKAEEKELVFKRDINFLKEKITVLENSDIERKSKKSKENKVDKDKERMHQIINEQDTLIKDLDFKVMILKRKIDYLIMGVNKARPIPTDIGLDIITLADKIGMDKDNLIAFTIPFLDVPVSDIVNRQISELKTDLQDEISFLKNQLDEIKNKNVIPKISENINLELDTEGMSSLQNKTKLSEKENQNLIKPINADEEKKIDLKSPIEKVESFSPLMLGQELTAAKIRPSMQWGIPAPQVDPLPTPVIKPKELVLKPNNISIQAAISGLQKLPFLRGMYYTSCENYLQEVIDALPYARECQLSKYNIMPGKKIQMGPNTLNELILFITENGRLNMTNLLKKRLGFKGVTCEYTKVEKLFDVLKMEYTPDTDLVACFTIGDIVLRYTLNCLRDSDDKLI